MPRRPLDWQVSKVSGHAAGSAFEWRLRICGI
jgi:hypothetical protein